MRYLFAFLFATPACFAFGQVALNQVDTFQDGTTMSWSGAASPTNIANGGPGGVGDRYLQITATGTNLATFNTVRWSGNYTSTGVNRIEVDLRNTGPDPLSIRLVLFAATTDRWSSNAVAVLSSGSPWTHMSWDLVESNFTHTIGTIPFSTMMGGMNRIMFRHEPTISAHGTPVNGQLGIDNVAGYASISNVFPTSFNFFGLSSTGTLADLLTSNNSYLVVKQTPFRSRLDPAVRLEVATTAPPGNFSSLEFTLETHTDAVAATDLPQKIELFRYTTNEWVEIDTRTSSSTDQTVVVTLNGNVNQFINPADRAMKARFSYFDPGNLLTRSWGVSFDFVRWMLTR